MSRPALSIALLCCLASLPSTLRAQGDDSAGTRGDPVHRQALEHYARGEYARAADAFKAAYLAEPKPELLYAIGQALRLAGRCGEALEHYGQYLRTHPGPKQVISARENMKRCERAVASPPASLAVPAWTSDRKAAPPRSPRLPPQSQPWYRDWLGGTLVAAGLVAAGAGAGVFAVGRGRVGEANDATSYGELERLHSGGQSGEVQQRAGVAVMVTGAALLTAGVVRYVLWRRSAARGAR
jgi:tetratricopeptide (TPR) repeat protein